MRSQSLEVYFGIFLFVQSAFRFHTCILPRYLGEALLSCLPVDDVPYSIEVFGLAVLVLETVVVSIGDSISANSKTY